MKERAASRAAGGLKSAMPEVRDVCVRVLAAEAPACQPNPPPKPERAACVPVLGRKGAQEALLSVLHDEKEDLPLFMPSTPWQAIARGSNHCSSSVARSGNSKSSNVDSTDADPDGTGDVAGAVEGHADGAGGAVPRIWR